MKKEELTALKAITDIKELEAKLKEKKSELLNLRFQLAIGQLENTSALKDCKKDIARIETVKRQLELSKTAKA